MKHPERICAEAESRKLPDCAPGHKLGEPPSIDIGEERSNPFGRGRRCESRLPKHNLGESDEVLLLPAARERHAAWRQAVAEQRDGNVRQVVIPRKPQPEVVVLGISKFLPIASRIEHGGAPQDDARVV